MDLQAPHSFQNKCAIVHDHRQQAGSYKGLSRASGKMPGRLCLAEGLCHDDLTAG